MPPEVYAYLKWACRYERKAENARRLAGRRLRRKVRKAFHDKMWRMLRKADRLLAGRGLSWESLPLEVCDVRDPSQVYGALGA